MINLLLSNEKLNDFQVCPLLYYYKHELRKAPVVKAVFFEEGDLMHEILRLYYLDKMEGKNSPWHSFLDLGRNYAAKKLAIKSDVVETVIADAEMYFHFYAGNESWTIEGVEEPFAKELFSDGNIRVIVQGKSDLRIKISKGPRAIVDHKYEARFKTKQERDNQPLCYSWAYETRDFIYNRIGKNRSANTKVEEKLLRPYLSYSDYQIDDWVQSAIDTAKEIITCYSANYWPMKYHGCTVEGNKCTFYEICNTTPNNREYKMNTFFKDREAHNVMEK